MANLYVKITSKKAIFEEIYGIHHDFLRGGLDRGEILFYPPYLEKGGDFGGKNQIYPPKFLGGWRIFEMHPPFAGGLDQPPARGGKGGYCDHFFKGAPLKKGGWFWVPKPPNTPPDL